MSIQCSEIAAFISAYLDDELADGERADVDRHLETCPSCAAAMEEEAQFLASVRASLRTPATPELLAKRIGKALDSEDSALRRERRKVLWAWALPATSTLAAAAALLLFIFSPPQAPQVASPITKEVVDKRFDAPLQVVQSSSRPEVTRVAADFVRKPVRPPRFADPGVSLRGYQQSSVQRRDALLVVYDLDEGVQRNTIRLFIFDAEGIDLRGSVRREVRGRALWVTQFRGMSAVSYTDDRGVGYVFASDMAPSKLLDLVERSDLTML